MEKKLFQIFGILLAFFFISSNTMQNYTKIALIANKLHKMDIIDKKTNTILQNTEPQRILYETLYKNKQWSNDYFEKILTSLEKEDTMSASKLLLVFINAINEVIKEERLLELKIIPNKSPLSKTFSFSKKNPDSPLDHINILFNNSSEEEKEEEEINSTPLNTGKDELCEDDVLTDELSFKYSSHSYKSNSIKTRQSKAKIIDPSYSQSKSTSLKAKVVNDDDTNLEIIKINISPENASPPHIIFNNNNNSHYEPSTVSIHSNDIEPSNHLFFNANNKNSDLSDEE